MQPLRVVKLELILGVVLLRNFDLQRSMKYEFCGIKKL